MGTHGETLSLKSLMLELLSQEANSHLQDVGFLNLGVGLLVEELWTQEGLELLDAAVDAISAHLLNNWFSYLQRARTSI